VLKHTKEKQKIAEEAHENEEAIKKD